MKWANVTFAVVVLDKYHWMLYFLVPAMYPRFLITLDDDLEPKPVTVRVGTVSPYMLPSSSFLFIISNPRLSTLWVKQVNLGQSPASRPIRHPYGWRRRNVRSSQRKNIFRSRAYWKDSSYCRRTRAGKRRWSCRSRLVQMYFQH
jgi:hypothetical protein